MKTPNLTAESGRGNPTHPPHALVVILGMPVMLATIVTAVAYHPQSIQGTGSRLLAIDALLLLIYGAVGVWAYYDNRPYVTIALRVGTRVGFLLAMVLIVNHLIELFVAARPFAVIISPVLLLIGLLGAAGSATWQRTASVTFAVASGVWSSIVAVLIGLTVAFCLSLAFRQNAELPLRELFAESGLTDPDAFLVKIRLMLYRKVWSAHSSLHFFLPSQALLRTNGSLRRGEHEVISRLSLLR